MYNKKQNDYCTDRFKEYVADKRVLLVGNAASLFSSDKHGELIDSYDVVLRFGKGCPDEQDAAYLGTKKDVWFFGAGRAGVYHRFNQTKWRIFTPSQLKVYSQAEDLLVPRIMWDGTLQVYRDFFLTGTAQEVYDLNVAINGNDAEESRLSQGVQAVHWFVNKVATQRSLSLIGFDFFEQPFNYTFDNSRNPKIPRHHVASSWHCPLVSGQYEYNPHSFGTPGDSNEKKYILGLSGVEHIKMPPIDYDKMESVLKRLRGNSTNLLR